ncbi:MAG: hypothetical protein O2779_04610 [Nanoarchaeota archaeon]|nr:hypothetical protein [Nanoarchaeota archaeon]
MALCFHDEGDAYWMRQHTTQLDQGLSLSEIRQDERVIDSNSSLRNQAISSEELRG